MESCISLFPLLASANLFTLELLLFTNHYPADMHKRYIKGFPDVDLLHWGFGQVEESANTREYNRNADGSETETKHIPEPLW